MADTATITIAQQPDGSFSADVSPPAIKPDNKKNVKLKIDTPGWMFDGVTSPPPKAQGWTNVGSGVFIENGSDFTKKADSTSTEVKLKDKGDDKGQHPQHHYLCCLTNGSSMINTDPIIIDRDGN